MTPVHLCVLGQRPGPHDEYRVIHLVACERCVADYEADPSIERRPLTVLDLVVPSQDAVEFGSGRSYVMAMVPVTPHDP